MSNRFQDYYDDLDLRDLAPKSRHIYKVFVGQYQDWLDGRKPDVDTLKAYLAYLRDEKRERPHSIASKYRILYQFHRFIGQEVEKFHIRLRVPKLLPPFIHPEEIRLLLAQITPEVTPIPSLRMRDNAIITTFALTGMRLAELCDLAVKDADLRSDFITVFGKGSKMRNIPINQELHQILKEYLASTKLKPNDSLFGCSQSNVKRIVRKYADLAGLKHIHAHSLRHFYGSQLANKGESIRVAQELLGHADPATTAIYQQVAPEHLKRAASSVSINDEIGTSGKVDEKVDAIAKKLGLSPELVTEIAKLLAGAQ